MGIAVFRELFRTPAIDTSRVMKHGVTLLAKTSPKRNTLLPKASPEMDRLRPPRTTV